MNKWSFIFAWFIASSVVYGAHAADNLPNVIDFDFALSQGLKSSPKISKAEIAVDISHYELMRAQSPFYPHLDVSTSVQRIKTFGAIPGLESLLLSGRDSVDYATAQVQLGLNIFNGGADYANWKLADEKKLEMSKQLQLSRQSIAEKVLAAYHDVHLAQIDVRTAQLRCLLGKELLEKDQSDFDQGQISALTLSESKYEQRRKEVLQKSAERKAINASRNLLFLLGIGGAEAGAAQISSLIVDYSRDLTSHGFDKSSSVSEVALSSSRVVQAGYSKKHSIGGYFPKLDLFARLGHSSLSPDGFGKALDGLARDKSYIGVSLTWNLFNGFDSYAEVQAKAREIDGATTDHDISIQEQRRNANEIQQLLMEVQEQLQMERSKYDLIKSRIDVQRVELDTHRRSELSFRETQIEMQIQEAELQKLEETFSYLNAKNILLGSTHDVQ